MPSSFITPRFPAAGGSGDVVGPGSSIANDVALFDGVTGKLLKGPGTSHMNIPEGTTAQRPGGPAQGMVRYNTDTNRLEWYSGVEWRNGLAGPSSASVGSLAMFADTGGEVLSDSMVTAALVVETNGAITPDAKRLACYSGVGHTIADPGTDACLAASGTTAQRPGAPVAGVFRYNTDDDKLEYFNGTIWIQLDAGGGGGNGFTLQFGDPQSAPVGLVQAIVPPQPGWSTSQMGMACPIAGTLEEMSILMGSSSASTDSDYDVELYKLTSSQGTARTIGSGTFLGRVRANSGGSLGSSFYRSFSASGLAAAVSAGDRIFCDVAAVGTWAVTDMVCVAKFDA